MTKKLIVLILSGFWAGMLPAGIVHYDMEQSASPLIDQVGGETADAVDSGHLYNISGPTGWGNAVGLNANGAWQLDDAESAELNNLVNDFTVAAWVYKDSSIVKSGVSSEVDRIIGDDVAWDGDAWSVGVNNGNLRFTKNGIIDADTSVALPLDQWVHYAVVVSSTTGIEFYLNGALVETIGNTANLNVGDDIFGIGRSYGSGQEQWWSGSLDEIRVYDSVLSQSEIEQLAVPEPATMILLSLGGIAVLRRRHP